MADAFEITIPWTPVKALLHLAGKADIRQWVNGVWIDRRGPHLVLWATTGKILGAFQTEEPSTDGPDVFLPRDVLEACKDFAVSAVVKHDAGHMGISCLGTTQHWKDQAFVPPDWRRVVPARTSGIAQQFDATLIAQFLKVRKALGRREHESAISIAHNNGPTTTGAPTGALVALRDEPRFIGVLSPIHLDATGGVYSLLAPEWARDRNASPAEQDVGDLV